MRYVFVMEEAGAFHTTRSQRRLKRAIRAGANAYGPKVRGRRYVVFDHVGYAYGMLQRDCG